MITSMVKDQLSLANFQKIITLLGNAALAALTMRENPGMTLAIRSIEKVRKEGFNK